jgi:hypothetical protein
MEFHALSLGSETTSDATTENENFKTPLVLGVFLDRPIGKGLGVSGGMVYTRMESYVESAGESLAQRLDITRQYLGVAANGYYSFQLSPRVKRLSLYVNAGLQFDFGLGKHSELRTHIGQTLVGLETLDSPSGSQASANMGAGLRYALLKRVGVFVQGTAAHYFFQSEDNLWSTKPIWPMAQVGLRVTL